jgi:hypothetical protein
MVDSQEFVKLQMGQAVEMDFKLATVEALFTSGTAKIKFFGESTASEKEYSYLSTYRPTLNDTVLVIPFADTYIIAGKLLYQEVIEDKEVTQEQLTEILTEYAKVTDLVGFAKTSDLTSYAQKSDLDDYALDDHSHSRITNGSNTAGLMYSVNNVWYFVPSSSSMALGYTNSYRWSVLYATTSTINTSDENEKQQIRDINETEKRVAIKLKGAMKAFKFNDAVQQKKDDARIHFGIIAQEVKRIFESEGLDPYKYALFCSDTWYEKDGSQADDNGRLYTKDDEGVTELTRLGIRYEELLCFIISSY